MYDIIIDCLPSSGQLSTTAPILIAITCLAFYILKISRLCARCCVWLDNLVRVCRGMDQIEKIKKNIKKMSFAQKDTDCLLWFTGFKSYWGLTDSLGMMCGTLFPGGQMNFLPSGQSHFV